jgi:anti-sigma factor RsiW
MTDQPALTDKERENLVAYLDGELPAAAARALEAKLQQDPRARAEAEALRRTWAMLDLLPQPKTSPAFTSQTLERLAVQRPKAAPAHSGIRRWVVPIAWAELIIVAGLLGYAGGRLAATRTAAPPANVDQVSTDQHLVRDLRVVENLRRYQHVPDLEFLRGLADPRDPDLFGDDSPSP